MRTKRWFRLGTIDRKVSLEIEPFKAPRGLVHFDRNEWSMDNDERRGMKSKVIRKRAGFSAAVYSRKSDRKGQVISARHVPLFGQERLPNRAPRVSDLNLVTIVDQSGCPIQRNRCVRQLSAKIIHSDEPDLHGSRNIAPQKKRPLGQTTERSLCRVHCCLLLGNFNPRTPHANACVEPNHQHLEFRNSICLTAVAPTLV